MDAMPSSGKVVCQMSYAAGTPSDINDQRRKFTRWIYLQRAIGLAFGFLCVATVLMPRAVPWWGWAGTGAAGFLWPHVAYLLAARSSSPLGAEKLNLRIDSFIGGIFLPVISFNILPSATFITMLSMNNIGVGGLRLFVQGLGCIAAGTGLSGLAFGFSFDTSTTTAILAVTLPMLVVYPLMTGAIAYKFADRLKGKRDELQRLYAALQEQVESLEDSNRRIKAAEEKYRKLTEEITDTIFEVGSDGVIGYISPAIEIQTGFSSQELTGKRFWEVIHPDDVELIRSRFVMALEGRAVPSEYRLKTMAGGEVWVRSYSKTILNEAGRSVGIRGVLTNIEDIKRAERERAEFMAALHDRQKVEMLGTLAGGIAHDFNNILTAIMGYSEMLGRYLDGDPKGRGYLDGLKKSTERAAALVRQILTVSGQREEQRLEIDLREIVTEVASMLRAAIPATISVEHSVPGERVPVVADQSQMYQAVMNLGTNAFQAASGKGGKIRLSLDTAFLPEPVAVLKVIDDGPGIPPSIAGRIFDPYFTTKEVGKGSGMGLAIVKGIVTAHGGEILCGPTLGGGATFTVTLPLSERARAGAQAAEAEICKGTGRILFVDDEEAILELGVEMLGGLGYFVRPVSDPKTALAVFRENPTSWDLVITDQTMPFMTGRELTENILAVRPAMPVLICTGYSELLDAVGAAKTGAKGFMHKPYTLASLSKAVKAAMEGGAVKS